MPNTPEQSANDIIFGWDRPSDELSLKTFLHLFCQPDFLDQLIPRLSDQEITDTVEHLSRLMREHLSEKEYHRLFLSGRK